jgi:predicted TPR repeat methyltransferase
MSDIEKIVKWYDVDAPAYDNRIVKSGWLGNRVLRQAFHDFPQAPRTMLDLGAGTGNTIGVVRETADPERIVAVDISEGMLDRLREKYSDDPKILIARKAVEVFLAESDEQFDLVTAIAVMQYFPDQPGVIADIATRLHDGGYAMFTYDPPITGDPIQEKRYDPADDGAAYRIPGNEVEDAVRENGLVVVRNELYRARPGDESGYTANFVVAKKPDEV